MKKISLSILLLSFLLGNINANTPVLTTNTQQNQNIQKNQTQYSNFFNKMFTDDFFNRMNNLNQVMMKELQTDDFFSNKSWLRFDKKNKTYEVHIDMGNLDKNEIDITTQNNFLIVKGNGASKTNNSQQITQFHQSFNLPADAEITNISAKQMQGILVIKIPQIKSKLQKIKVQ